MKLSVLSLVWVCSLSLALKFNDASSEVVADVSSGWRALLSSLKLDLQTTTPA